MQDFKEPMDDGTRKLWGEIEGGKAEWVKPCRVRPSVVGISRTALRFTVDVEIPRPKSAVRAELLARVRRSIREYEAREKGGAK